MIKRINKITLQILLVIIVSCSEGELDPTPVLSFQQTILTCYLESSHTCYNPVTTSIKEGVKLADGSFIWYSGTISISSSNPEIALPNGDFIELRSVGECTITATQKASKGYNTEAKAHYKLIVMPKQDEIPELTWGLLNDTYATFYFGAGDSLINPAITNLPRGGVITYSSTNPSVATVDKSGLMRAHMVGSTKIIATQEGKQGVNRTISTSYNVVVDPRPVISFVNGSSYTCTLDDGKAHKNEWVSSISNGGPLLPYVSEPIAIVDNFGNILMYKPGEAKVWVHQHAKPGVNASGSNYYNLTIKPPKPNLFFENGTEFRCSLINGPRQNAISEYSLGNIEYTGLITYYSDDESIARVDNRGIVEPLKAGQVTINAYFPGVAGLYRADTVDYTLTIIDYPFPDLRWSHCGGTCSIACQISSANPQFCIITALSDIPDGGKIYYQSLDSTICSVDGLTGQITPKKDGYTYILGIQEEKVGKNARGEISIQVTAYK